MNEFVGIYLSCFFSCTNSRGITSAQGETRDTTRQVTSETYEDECTRRNWMVVNHPSLSRSVKQSSIKNVTEVPRLVNSRTNEERKENDFTAGA